VLVTIVRQSAANLTAQEVCLWPETEVARRPQFGHYRVESRHHSDIAEVMRLTRSGPIAASGSRPVVDVLPLLIIVITCSCRGDANRRTIS
jgi:hypothetical protein